MRVFALAVRTDGCRHSKVRSYERESTTVGGMEVRDWTNLKESVAVRPISVEQADVA
jgi:hypothetical protein